MFRSARWRSDKKKIISVFKLQFHATQLSRFGGDALMICLVPADTGKPTVKSEKAIVGDGTCYWENPLYETIKFVQESKTGKIHERVYYFVVATGSFKTGLVGEVSLDFASYAEATKISSVSLPLKNAKFEAVLHVTIQKMQESADQREVGESEYLKLHNQDRSCRNNVSDGHMRSHSTEDGPCNKTISHFVESNGNRRASSGSDITTSSSEISFGLDTPRELGRNASPNTRHGPRSFSPSSNHVSLPQKPSTNASTTIDEENQRSQWEWLGGSAPEVSTDGSSSSPSGALSRERSQDASDVVIEKLRTELAVLSRQTEVSELELQTLRKHIVKESKRGQDLSKEVISLKEERDAFKEEFEKLKPLQTYLDEAKLKKKLQLEGADSWTLVEELRQELNHEKDLNANLRLQLKKTQESNSELILAINDLDELLEQKNKEISDLSSQSAVLDNAKCETDDEEQQKALEELVKEHGDAKEMDLLEQKIVDLYNEIEISRREKDELETQTEQLALDYEILKQEHHEISYKLEQIQLQEQLKMQYECSSSDETIYEPEAKIESLGSDLRKQSQELSDSLGTIKELEIQIKSLEEELEKQAEEFEADVEAITRAKIEQEQRAIHAEETLRKTRWKNANTAGRLQEKFRKLSMQIGYGFDANEKLATKALTEANELRLENSHLEDMLEKTKVELQSVRDYHEARMQELSNHLSLKTKQIEKMQSEINNKSVQLEHQKEHVAETHDIFSKKIIMLEVEFERLRKENNIFSEQKEQKEVLEVELEQQKRLIEDTKMLIERRNAEKRELETILDLVKKESDEAFKELSILRCLKDEKESLVGDLQVEIETLKSQCDNLRQSSFENELEKERLKKQLLQLETGVTKEEDEVINADKKLEYSSNEATVLEGTNATPENGSFVSFLRGTKEVVNLEERIVLLERQIKHKENALEATTSSFVEKEKSLQNKIEVLEGRLEELQQNFSSLCKYEIEKVTGQTEDFSLGCKKTEAINMGQNFSPMAYSFNEDGSPVPLIRSDEDCLSVNEAKTSPENTSNLQDIHGLLNEMTLLKERNKSMDSELKEMQERYSEISLKFAEVEGERQRLVMKLRNHKKNGKKK